MTAQNETGGPFLPKRRWARALEAGAHGLRRGAWYLVVSESPVMLVLEIRHRNVPVPHALVEVRDEPPSQWSVVSWKAGQSGAHRASQVNVSLTYAVCPRCADRTTIDPPDATHMRCEVCGGEFGVDWEHPC